MPCLFLFQSQIQIVVAEKEKDRRTKEGDRKAENDQSERGQCNRLYRNNEYQLCVMTVGLQSYKVELQLAFVSPRQQVVTGRPWTRRPKRKNTWRLLNLKK